MYNHEMLWLVNAAIVVAIATYTASKVEADEPLEVTVEPEAGLKLPNPKRLDPVTWDASMDNPNWNDPNWHPWEKESKPNPARLNDRS